MLEKLSYLQVIKQFIHSCKYLIKTCDMHVISLISRPQELFCGWWTYTVFQGIWLTLSWFNDWFFLHCQQIICWTPHLLMHCMAEIHRERGGRGDIPPKPEISPQHFLKSALYKTGSLNFHACIGLASYQGSSSRWELVSTACTCTRPQLRWLCKMKSGRGCGWIFKSANFGHWLLLEAVFTKNKEGDKLLVVM